jgi:hypothetical protein
MQLMSGVSFLRLSIFCNYKVWISWISDIFHDNLV